MKKVYKIVFCFFIVIVVFSAGYYLRAYISLHEYLPYSPYEAFTSVHDIKPLNTGMAFDFMDKAARYPSARLLAKIFNPIFGDLYLVYILGAIVIFFLGKEISGDNLGGLLAFSVYALAPENLLQYTRALSVEYINSSGMAYVFIWTSLLFFIRYLKNKNPNNLILFIIFALLTFTSYHTAACALVVILIGIGISLYYSTETADSKIYKKVTVSFVGLIVFYLAWVKIFDPAQFVLIRNSVIAMDILKIFIFIISCLVFLICLYFIKDFSFLQSENIPLIILIPSAILVFSPFNFFQGLLRLGAKNYHVSAITLNNYIAQAVIVHVYVLILLPLFFKKELSPEQKALRGWFWGLIIIFVGLVFERFYARILDYSFPLMAVLFGLYWCKRKKFRVFIIPITLILLIVSQLRIYNDPFSMRRYYRKSEVDSVKSIIGLNLKGTMASDLRTSALFSYAGKKDVEFGRSGYLLHDAIFYEHDKIPSLENVDYVILSQSMKEVVYSTNFATTPLKEETFAFYQKHFKEIYNDGLMSVYLISISSNYIKK
ncbi:MAG: hypothetical protein PHW62_03985 [Candidatus Ratteibacteria bacterium]|nr:hypothetical protein [Candidatus Ratteibacteria bacterium]